MVNLRQRVSRRLRHAAKRVPGYPMMRGGALALLRRARLQQQLVVCGYPRGGTSLLYNMLSSSLENFHFADFEASALETIGRFGNYASKLPMDVFNIDRLPRRNRWQKDITVVVVLRDPRDLITSVHPNVPDDYFMSYEWRWSPRGKYPYVRVRDDRGVRAVHDAIEHAKRVEGLRVMIVRYEDLISAPDAVQDRLASEAGLRFRSRFSRFSESPERHAYRYEGATRPLDKSLVRENQPVDRSRMGKWRRSEHTDRIRIEFGSHPELFDLVRTYGYEQDDEWYKEYASVRAVEWSEAQP